MNLSFNRESKDLGSRKEDSSYKEEDLTYIGIDLGGSACTVSYYKNNNFYTVANRDREIFPMSQRLKTFPTCAAYTPENKLVTGSNAYTYRYNPDVHYIDRIKEKLYLNLDIIHESKKIKTAYIISELFYNLKREVEREVGHKVSKAVITIPANFGEGAKVILKDAAELADLEVIRLISEPTAALLYYAQKWKINTKKINYMCLIIDIGSLTLDITICEISQKFIKVDSTKGHYSCGMYLVDQALKELILEKLSLNYPTLRNDLNYIDHQKLTDIAEQIKVDFEMINSDEYHFRRTIVLANKIVELDLTFTKNDLWNAYKLYFQEFHQIYKELMKSTGMTSKMIDRMILVGGSVNSSIVRNKVRELIDCPMETFFDNVSSVSKGAAYYGYLLESQNCEFILADIVPVSLGIEIENKRHQIIIPSGSCVPSKKRIICTTTPGKDYLMVNILEGDSFEADECKKLGTLTISNEPQNYIGALVLEIEMSVNVDKELQIKVIDRKTKKNIILSTENYQKIKPLELQKLKEHAIKYRAENNNYYDKMLMIEDLKTYLKLAKEMKNKNPKLEDLLKTATLEINNIPLDYLKLTSLYENLCIQMKEHCKKSDLKSSTENENLE